MLKITFCLRRRPGMSRDAFLTYWRERHGPLMRQHWAALGARGYRQMRRLDGGIADKVAGSRGGPEPFDGVAEVWWDSLEDFQRSTGAADGRAAGKALLEDEARFIDLKNSPIFLTESQFGLDRDR
jgi:uncharacterized protein (TIGR02118 family)